MAFYSRSSLWRIFGSALGQNYVPRPSTEIWNKFKSLGIARVTSRGCRSGAKKQRPIATVLGNGKYSAGYQEFYSPKLVSPWNQRMLIQSSLFKKQVNYSNLIRIRTRNYTPASYSPKAAFALWNARSINNKIRTLCDFIITNRVDIMVITETWLNGDDRDNRTISDISNTLIGYDIVHVPRKCRYGGGVAAIVRKGFTIAKNSTPNYKAMECLDNQRQFWKQIIASYFCLQASPFIKEQTHSFHVF